MKENQFEVTVTGMTCNHCRGNVERAILGMEGVTGVEADVQTGKVLVRTEKLDLQLLKKNLESLGYGLRDSKTDQ